MLQSDALTNLVAVFRTLPGVGVKTAFRYAYKVIEMDNSQVAQFIEAIEEAKEKINFCSVCGNYCEGDCCTICQHRDKSVICVVSQPKDITSFEKIGEYNGVYHVLHGSLDFQKGIGVDDIKVKELMARLTGVREIIVATNADVSGELTASYIANSIKPLGIKVTRLAYGISIGSEIEYADEITLARALKDRKEL